MVAAPKTIVIERRWAIVGGAVIVALIIGLGVALPPGAGDRGRPPNSQGGDGSGGRSNR